MNASNQDVTWLHRLAGFIGFLYLQLVGKTSFVHRSDDAQSLEIRRKKSPAIYAFWHNNQVFLAYDHRSERVHIMVSRSKDGEYIAQVMNWMGLNAIRGSSTRGGDQALREMCSLLGEGAQVGFTPDGPKGPLQTIHGGIISAARVSGAPIVPIAVFARRKITFNSWDKFFLPLPFNSIVVAHGRPFVISRSDSIESAEERIRAALNQVAEMAKEAEAKSPSWATSFFGSLFLLAYSLLGFVFAPLLFPI